MKKTTTILLIMVLSIFANEKAIITQLIQKIDEISKSIETSVTQEITATSKVVGSFSELIISNKIKIQSYAQEESFASHQTFSSLAELILDNKDTLQILLIESGETLTEQLFLDGETPKSKIIEKIINYLEISDFNIKVVQKESAVTLEADNSKILASLKVTNDDKTEKMKLLKKRLAKITEEQL